MGSDPGMSFHFCVIAALSPAGAMVSSEIVSGPVAIGNFPHWLPGFGIGESLGAKDLGPFLEGQVHGQHEAMMLIGPADDLEE